MGPTLCNLGVFSNVDVFSMSDWLCRLRGRIVESASAEAANSRRGAHRLGAHRAGLVALVA
jgi:hypothetical protein